MPTPAPKRASARPAVSASFWTETRSTPTVRRSQSASGKSVPAVDLVRGRDDPPVGVHRPAEADPDGPDRARARLQPEPAEQRSERLDDLRENPFHAVSGDDRPALQGLDPAVAAAEPELKLRPTDLDPEQERNGHVGSSLQRTGNRAGVVNGPTEFVAHPGGPGRRSHLARLRIVRLSRPARKPVRRKSRNTAAGTVRGRAPAKSGSKGSSARRIGESGDGLDLDGRRSTWCLGLAGYLTSRHGFRQPAGWPRTFAAVVLGWGWLTIGMEFLGVLGLLQRGPLLGWSAVGTADRARLPRRASPVHRAGRGTKLAATRWSWEEVVTGGLVLWAAVILGTESLLMPVKVVTDGPIYHLYFAARWWKSGRLDLIAAPFGENAATYFPAVGDLWFTWLMIGWGGDRLAKVGQAPFLGSRRSRRSRSAGGWERAGRRRSSRWRGS